MVLGRKIGMARIFDEKGRVIPVTAVEVVPGEILQIKTPEADRYGGLKIGVGKKEIKRKESGKTKLKYQKIREFKSVADTTLKIGEKIGIEIFEPGDLVKVTGISKGKGFAGTIKRHGFKRGPETHGSDHHRQPGSIGSMFPQRVLKGKRMPGRMGVETVTLRKRPILKVVQEKNLILIEGSLPGPNKGWLKIEKENIKT